MHRHAVAPRDEPSDLVTGHRGAAARELDPDIAELRADHGHTGIVGLLAHLRDALRGDALRGVVGCCTGTTSGGHKVVDDGLGTDPALTDRGVERADVVLAQVGCDCRQRGRGQQPVDRDALLAHGLEQLVLALLDGLLATLAGEPGLDLAAGPRAADEGQPVAARTGALGLGREDLHGVTVGQRDCPAGPTDR